MVRVNDAFAHLLVPAADFAWTRQKSLPSGRTDVGVAWMFVVVTAYFTLSKVEVSLTSTRYDVALLTGFHFSTGLVAVDELLSPDGLAVAACAGVAVTTAVRGSSSATNAARSSESRFLREDLCARSDLVTTQRA